MPSKRNLRVLLTGRQFRRLLIARLTSQFSDGLFSGALAGSILFNPNQHTDPIAIATGFAVLLLPYSILGPFVGVFLDRWLRRNVISYANVLRAGLALPAAALLYTGHPDTLFILLALLVIGINRFILAGHSAAMPHVVDGPRLITANAVSPTLGTVCNSIALGLSALLQFSVAGNTGYGLLGTAAAAGFLLAGVLAGVFFHGRQLGPDASARAGGSIPAELYAVLLGMLAGARHLLGHANSTAVLAAQSAYRILYGVLTVAALLLYRNYFATGTDYTHSIAGLAQVVLAGGVGSFLGAVVTPPAARRLGDRNWLTLLLVGAGLVVVVFGSPFREMLLVATVLAINIASQGTKIVVDTTLQAESADEFRGRVFSVNDTTYNICYVLGLFLGAVLLPPDGHSLVGVVLVGCGYAAVGVGHRLVPRLYPLPSAVS